MTEELFHKLIIIDGHQSHVHLHHFEQSKLHFIKTISTFHISAKKNNKKKKKIKR